MKGKVLVAGILLLLTATISSAQVILNKKSTILPEQSQRVINPWSVVYAQNTGTGETLIVWYEWISDGVGTTLTGRIADGKGKAIGKPFTILSQTQKPGDIFNCCFSDRATYNPFTNEYFVTHSEGHEDATGQFEKILAQRLAADGRLKGSQIDLTSRFPERAPFSNKPIVLKFNPVTSGYLQFSLRHTVPAHTTTVGFYELLTPEGEPAQPPVITNWFWPVDFTFEPSGKMLMSSVHRAGLDVEYAIASVDPRKKSELQNLKPEDWTSVARTTNPVPTSRPELIVERAILEVPPSDSPILYFTDNANVKGQKFSADGKLEGASFSGFNPPAKNIRLLASAVAFSATSQGVVGMLIALDDEGYPNGSVSVWAQALNSQGRPVGSSKKLYTTSVNERIETNELFALPAQSGDTVARFVWYGLKADYFESKFAVLKFDLSLRLP